jgi:sulfonate transport system substrate-binding protein
MQASGALEGISYQIVWSEFGAASPLLEALSAGAVDIGGVGDAPFLYAYAAGAQIKAVTALQASASGASTAVVVPQASPLHTVQDLKGRRVATGKGSVGHYLLLRLLDQAGLPFSTVEAVFMTPGDCKAALERGAVDAWSTWSPYIGLATLHGSARVLADGRGLFPGYSFMAARDAAIHDKRAQLSDFVHRLAIAYRWGHANPDRLAAALSRETGLPVDVSADQVRRQNYSVAPLSAEVARAEQATLDLYRRAGVASAGRTDLSAAFDPSFNAALG